MFMFSFLKDHSSPANIWPERITNRTTVKNVVFAGENFLEHIRYHGLDEK